MFVRVNATNGVPVYDQIARQVKFAVADGALTPGDLIPSVRELSKELAVNPNTVARAYRELQNDEIVESARGVGLAVRQGAAKTCRAHRSEWVRRRMRLALEEAFDAGLSSEQVEKLVGEELRKLIKARPSELNSGDES